MSFKRNCPGTTESAGNPIVECQPGVESRKVSVVTNIPAARKPPTAAIRGDAGLKAIIRPRAISTTPKAAEKARTLITEYVQLSKGLLATNGWIPSAS